MTKKRIELLTDFSEANTPIVMFDGRYSEGVYAVIAPPALAAILHLGLQDGGGAEANIRHHNFASTWFPGVLAETPTMALALLIEKIEHMSEEEFLEVKDHYGHLNCVLEYDVVCCYHTFDGPSHRNMRSLLRAAFPDTPFY